MEEYEVYFTKHLHQKTKTWEEGVLVYNLSNFKTSLLNEGKECVDSKFIRIKPDFNDGDELRTNKFLVQIIKKKMTAEEQEALEEKKNGKGKGLQL